MEEAIAVRNIILLLSVLCVLSCSKHENFPAALDVDKPPVVTNLAVTVVPQPDGIHYDITWDIDDSSVVHHYNVYALSEFTLPDLLGASETTAFLAESEFEIPTLAFGVTVVTTQFVEGSIVSAPAR